MFLVGTVSMYLAFNNVKTNTSISGLNPHKLFDCTSTDNQCTSLNGTQYMPFVYLAGDIVADGVNNQTVAVPEFYA